MDFKRWSEQDEPMIEEDFSEFLNAMQLHEVENITITGDKESFITEENAMDMGLSLGQDSVLYSIKLVSREPDLHYYLYNFSEDYGIKLIDHVSLIIPTSSDGHLLIQSGLITIKEEEDQSSNQIKLIVTRKPLVNPATLEQGGLPFTKDVTPSVKLASEINDWYCQNITVTLKRRSEENPIPLNKPNDPIDPLDPSLFD